MVSIELLRVVRHGVAPLVILAVDRGWLPGAAKGDVTEFLAILLSLGLAYGWSYWNERKRDNRVDPEQPGGTTDRRRAPGDSRNVGTWEDPEAEGPEASGTGCPKCGR
jgi:hypothetical protein